MKQQKEKSIDKNANYAESVFVVFNQINKIQSASKAQVFQLVKLFRNDPYNFQNAFELAYLKIFKIFHQKANRKMPPKFEQLPNTFFQEILDKQKDGPANKLFNFFLIFLAQAIFSSILGIRITSARMLFHLIKQGVEQIEEDTKSNILKSIFYLIRLKVSTYKQIGIKLASLVFSWQHQIRYKIEQQLFKILSTQDNEQIRKMAITNILICQQNLDRILLRLRDKCLQIRTIILRKLIGQKYKLDNMKVSNRIHLLYDGYGNKDVSIQQQTLRYFTKYFQLEKNNKDAFSQFVEYFQPNTLLVYPHLYTLFDNLLSGIIEELPLESLCNFTRHITNELKQISKSNGGGRSRLRQLIWLKNIGKSQQSQLKSIFEECIPSGLQFSKIILDLIQQKDIFTINECLQIISLQKSADQLGKNKMFDSLKKIVANLQYFQVDLNWQGLETDDICPPISDTLLWQRKMMLSYFDLPLISNSYDLLYEIGNAMKVLWPDHYEIELKQIMAEWNNPEENNLFKEKELTLANIRKVEAQGQNRLIESLKMKLRSIQQQLEIEGSKTRSIIIILNRLRSTISMDDFMPIIKEDLAKAEQSQGLILLGLYCLEQSGRVQIFMPLYWLHITGTANTERIKPHLMVSLKATTDFMVKFDLSKLTYNNSEENPFSYHKYVKKMLELVLDSDPDIRILAIEGLCRMIYHNRVVQESLGNCFMRLLLLWWETSSQEISAKSVHTISIFVKQYIEKGPSQVRKLSQSLCIFFKVLLLKQGERKIINKSKITYNLKMQEFVKRSVVIAMTVLKYHKESRQIIWKYQDSGAELGPQELFILFLFKHDELHYCLQKALNICDFYEEAPLETVILMKKQVETMLQDVNFINKKNLQGMLKKLDQDLSQRIQIKNQQTFNDQLLNGLKKEFKEYELLITNSASRLGEQLQGSQIFTLSPDVYTSNIKAEQSQQLQISESDEDAIIADIDDPIPVSSESEHISKQINKSVKEEEPRKNKRQQEKNKNKKNRKRAPQLSKEQQQELSQSHSHHSQNHITHRTRSRHKV